MRYAIKVIWDDGDEDYVMQGERVAAFGKLQAKEQVEFLRVGMEDECQSINIVRYPKK